jgi:putative peptide zinc metalloprotease protein
LQYERWRKRNFPTGEVEEAVKKKKYTFATYLQYSLLLSLFIVLLIPYDYEPGGYFSILPPQKQEITSELAGIIDEVHFDGGEFLTKGTIIGRLSCTEDLAQEKIYAAKIEEQKAIVDELKGRPRPEEVALAESDLRTEETRVQFSKDKLGRWEKLFAQKSISLEELETVRREYQIDSGRAEEKRANLELIKSGATAEQIAAAEAKLRSLQEEHDYYLQRIEQSIFSMPFDGTLVAMQLKQKTGSFLDKGKALATVENTRQVIAQIDVPEPDIGYVKESAKVRARAQAYYDEDVTGVVTAIDPTVMEQEFGRVVRVTTTLNNADGRLKSGMTGYAKISSVTLPVWEVLSQQVVRFISVEVWSWLP